MSYNTSYNNVPCQQSAFSDTSYNTPYNSTPYQQQISHNALHNNRMSDDTSSNNSFYQPSMSNDTLLNNTVISPNHNYDSLNNIPYNNYQQSTSDSISNNLSLPQCAIQNSPQPNIFSPINPLSITINSTYVIVMPAATNPDIQHQLQQVHTYLNHSSSTVNSQTRT
jgi:hypothetical protein